MKNNTAKAIDAYMDVRHPSIRGKDRRLFVDLLNDVSASTHGYSMDTISIRGGADDCRRAKKSSSDFVVPKKSDGTPIITIILREETPESDIVMTGYREGETSESFSLEFNPNNLLLLKLSRKMDDEYMNYDGTYHKFKKDDPSNYLLPYVAVMNPVHETVYGPFGNLQDAFWRLTRIINGIETEDR